MTRRLLLHVGTPKTGTSLLQHALHTHRDELAETGLLYPGHRPDAHFLAALDLMGLRWGGLELEAEGAWSRLVEEVRSWPGDAIVSHEILGAATNEQAARAVADLAGPDTEVHLLISARDLARQVPAEWQENLKHRRTVGYADFFADLRDPGSTSAITRWFWSVQDLPDLLGRWAAGLPPERVHLVTVPPPGAAPGLLWQRFVAAFGLEGHDLAPEGRANASVGVPESAMLRRLNERLNHDPAGDPPAAGLESDGTDGSDDADDAGHDAATAGLPSEHYRPLVRELLVHQHLGGRPGSPRLVLPPSLQAWAHDTATAWVADLTSRGHRVHGDLADLVPAPVAAGAFADPDDPDEQAVADAALEALALMTREAARLREVERDLDSVVADQGAQLDRLYGTRGYRLKQRLVASAEHNPVTRAAYAGYRRLRSSSTSA